MWSMLMIYAVWRSAVANLALKSVRLISVLVGDISRDAAHLNVVKVLCYKLVWSFGSIGTATKQHRPTIMLNQAILYVCLHAGPASLASEHRLAA